MVKIKTNRPGGSNVLSLIHSSEATESIFGKDALPPENPYVPMMDELLYACLHQKASDLYITYGCPPSIRVNDEMYYFSKHKLDDEDIDSLMKQLLTDEQLDEFGSTMELNTSISWEGESRFRINVYRQQNHTGMVIRRIQTSIPTTEELKLPEVYERLAMLKRGLILVVGQTGCGKSTSLAAMIGYRNQHSSGHIITIEDPIEFVHSHRGCIVSQRDVGIDTYSYAMALKNALRQHPDVILIGEIRDRETMEHAINFAETGHLCMATLHSNNAHQAIERILSFFPEERHAQVRLNLSNNLRGIVSQRLVSTISGERALAIEVMLNEGLVTALIHEGKIKEIKEIMEKSRERGMQSFDQSLLDLYRKNLITEETALSEADNPSLIRLAIHEKDALQKIRMSNVHGSMGESGRSAPASEF